jgi:hypothetical protein
MLHSLLAFVGQISRRFIRSKPCAKCWDAHPFIKSHHLVPILQSITARHFGGMEIRTGIGAKNQLPLLNTGASLKCRIKQTSEHQFEAGAPLCNNIQSIFDTKWARF